MKDVLIVCTFLIALLAIPLNSSIAESPNISLEELPKKNTRPDVEPDSGELPNIPTVEYNCHTRRSGLEGVSHCNSQGTLSINQEIHWYTGRPIPNGYKAANVVSCSGVDEHALFLNLSFVDLSDESDLSELLLLDLDIKVDWDNDLSVVNNFSSDLNYSIDPYRDMRIPGLLAQTSFNGYNDGLPYSGYLGCEFTVVYQ